VPGTGRDLEVPVNGVDDAADLGRELVVEAGIGEVVLGRELHPHALHEPHG
jgi:hypothetical protein